MVRQAARMAGRRCRRATARPACLRARWQSPHRAAPAHGGARLRCSAPARWRRSSGICAAPGWRKTARSLPRVVPRAARRGLEFAGAAIELPGMLGCPASCDSRLMSAIELMAASASPRKPMVPTASRSCSEAILLVAWRLQRHRQFFARNAQAVVFHRISRTPPASSRTVTCVAPGVQRVVDQLAHHRGRALHHFAGGDLADQFIGKFADGAARGRVWRRHETAILGAALPAAGAWRGA